MPTVAPLQNHNKCLMSYTRNIVSIAGYVQHGHIKEALNCFDEMQHECCLSADVATIAWSLKVCGSIGAADKGKSIHDEIIRRGLLGKNLAVGAALVDMYAKCGAFAKAQQVLDELPVRNGDTWSVLITGYVQYGHAEEALKCFEQMLFEGLSSNAVTLACILKACGSIRAVDKGEKIHAEIVRQGLLGKDIVLGTALVDMYAKCGALAKAQQVFDELPVRDVVTWSALITGYARYSHGEEALTCFKRMQHEGLSPDAVTFVSVLNACASIGAAEKGEKIHADIVRQGLLGKKSSLANTLVDMYAKCGALAKAAQVLNELSTRNVVSWNALIGGYAKHGHGEEALDCFNWMQGEGISPNTVTFICILKACGSLGAADKGQSVHAEIVRRGLLQKAILLGTALLDMYAKCGVLASAQQVFDELPVRNTVSWNALIAGYAQHGHCKDALNCYEKMQNRGLSPDAASFTFILKACGSIGAGDKGQMMHAEIVRQGLLEKESMLGSALVDMYAKCGALVKAQEVLDQLPVRNLVSWSALIAGYAQHGVGEEALTCFEQMQHEGLSPNAVTFASVLNACSHSGLLEEGKMYFVNMERNYGIMPNLEHYTCMVDLFARAGDLDNAIAAIKHTPYSDCLSVWGALLGACQRWGNVKLGSLAFEHAVQLDKNYAAAYVCISNTTAVADVQEDKFGEK